jgi:hypothetical protein
VPTALVAIDRIAADFEIDALDFKAETLWSISENTEWPEALKDISRACLALVDEAAERDSSQLAERLALLALEAARKAEDIDLTKLAAHQVLRLRDSISPPADQ